MAKELVGPPDLKVGFVNLWIDRDAVQSLSAYYTIPCARLEDIDGCARTRLEAPSESSTYVVVVEGIIQYTHARRVILDR